MKNKIIAISLGLIFIFILNVKSIAQEEEPKYKREVSFKFNYKFKVEDGEIEKVRLLALIPHDIKNRQTVKSIKYSIQPDSLVYNGGNAYAAFTINSLSKKLDLEIAAKLTIYKYISKTNNEEDTVMEPFLKDEKYIEVNSPKIQETAKKLKDKNDIETIMRTFEFVQQNVSYKLSNEIGADSVLTTGEGKCSDFSDLFVALLRANKIPAKVVKGMWLSSNLDYPFHQWAEVYLKKQGWVLFEPTRGYGPNSGKPTIYKEGNAYKIRVQNRYVVLSGKRIDPFLTGRSDDKYWLSYMKYWGSNGCKMSFKTKWSYDFDD